jgi:hypothetical protein
MNAKDFFSESDYEKLLDIYRNEKIVDVLETPFKKTIRANGNTYSLLIYTDHYTPDVFGGAFFMSCFYDFNHKGPYQSRDIYGSSIKPDMTSYKGFLNSLNQAFKRAPDFTEDEEEPEQITFF